VSLSHNWENLVYQHGKLIQTLRLFPELDNIKIANKVDISSPTLYKAFYELKEHNILNADNRINLNFGTFVGISIGSSLCKVVLLHFDFSVYTEQEFDCYKKEIINSLKKCDSTLSLPIEKYKNYVYFNTPNDFAKLKQYLDCIFDSLAMFIDNGILDILSIGISSTGTVDEKNNAIYQSHNLEYLNGRKLNDLLFLDRINFFKNHGVSVHLVQNCNAAVIAEKFKLCEINNELRPKNNNIAALYLEYGMGAGFVINGKLYSGNGYAGEIGHIPAPLTLLELLDLSNTNNLKNCTCGAKYCIDHIMRSYVFDSLPDFKSMDSESIHIYLKERPQQSKYLGKIIGYITNLFSAVLNIDLVIFTGKLYKCIPDIYKYIEETLDENTLTYNRTDCNIITSKIGTLAPAIGAAIYSYYKKCNIELDWL